MSGVTIGRLLGETLRSFAPKQIPPVDAVVTRLSPVLPLASRATQRRPESGFHAPVDLHRGFDFSRMPLHANPRIRIQPKLTVGHTDDPLEHEADRIAGQVMRIPEPHTHVHNERGSSQGTSAEVHAGQTKPSGKGGDSAGFEAPPIVREALNSPGRPLDDATRAFFEPRFGRDFSRVRVHADARAAQSASTIGARAYTSGHHMVFAAGEYAPLGENGRRLIAHELAHTSQQRSANSTRIQRQPQPKPTPTYSPASNFADLITLIRTAEAKLKAKGQDVTTRLKTLRGLFYGTTWSMDFDHEHSTMRNLGFAYFLYGNPAIKTASNAMAYLSGHPENAKPDPAFVPADPAGTLDAGLIKALKDSAEVTNPADQRKVDVGHLLIGLEARLPKGGQEKAQLTDPRPLSSSPMGGTGLELTTWVGDLGGGTAQVAQLRITASKTTPAKQVFTGSVHDYGAEVNLEGDIAAFLAGLPTSAGDPYSIALDETKGVAGAIEDYVSPSGAGAAWKGRAKRFLSFYGATFDASGALSNRSAVVATFTDHIKKFAAYYKETRMKDELMKKLGSAPTSAQLAKIDADMKAIEAEIPKVAGEVAELFTDALMVAVKDPGKGIAPP
jgi:Domain of unknown function (DUF4157)